MSEGAQEKIMVETRKEKLKKAFAIAFPHTIPVFIGFLFIGMTYGLLMQTKGYSVFWSVMMSAIAFCGSMQFAAIPLLTTSFHPLQAFLLSLMINARHLFYGISMLEKYKGLGKIRGFLIYVLCDETFSISYGIVPPERIDRKSFYFVISSLHYLYWLFATFLGGILANFITFNTKGLDFVLTAFFIVLFLEQSKNKENQVFGVIGLLSTFASLLIFGKDHFLIPAMIIILTSLTIGRKKLCI